MIRSIVDSFNALMARGGWVMWPLLAMSLLAMTLVFERCWFWVRTNHPGSRTRVTRMMRLLRNGDNDALRTLVQDDRSVYGRVVMKLLNGHGTDAVESQRPRLERFMPTLSTIITAAPMLGILGTVTGIIASFEILADQTTTTDPRNVSRGIAEALLTTAAGLVVALMVLFPYNAFRAQIDRTLGLIESLLAAAGASWPHHTAPPPPEERDGARTATPQD